MCSSKNIPLPRMFSFCLMVFSVYFCTVKPPPPKNFQCLTITGLVMSSGVSTTFTSSKDGRGILYFCCIDLHSRCNILEQSDKLDSVSLKISVSNLRFVTYRYL